MSDIPASRIDRMRAVTRRRHAGQTRNGGRLPYWVHTDGVADICRQALAATGEATPDVADDVVLAAYGHDLYEDTDISPDDVRAEFGPRVDGWIASMTNRNGDDDTGDYMGHLAAAPDEVRIIKCADLIDNMLSVAYGLHDLGLAWANDFFLPIAADTRAVLVSTPFERLPRTGAYLLTLAGWAWQRLEGSIETASAIPYQAGDQLS
jgi:(p)ppGpp synthase/HD superfamily hydrolase